MAIKNLGSIVKKHSSGMVESDKGRRFPYIKANIGDFMIEEDGNIKIVSKEVFAKEYRAKINKAKKEEAEAKGEANA